MNIPNEFICPISLELMDDPVICNDGYSYEKKAILNWLKKSNISPMTREPIYNLLINKQLKELINDWKNENNYDLQNLENPTVLDNNDTVIPIKDDNNYESINNDNQIRRNILKKLTCVLCTLSFAIPILVKLVSSE